MMADIENSFNLCLANNRKVSLLKPSIMGIINASPDSFYRPYSHLDDILITIENMVQAGAAIIDIGGEATNPSVNLTSDLSIQEQLDRVIPLIEIVAKRFEVLISVDTSYPQVMREAVSHGAHMINDQRCLQIPGAIETVAELSVPVCLMHFFNQPRTPASNSLNDLFTQIKSDLKSTVERSLTAGIRAERIIIDPGFGQGHYGKNTEENCYLLSRLTELTTLGYPVLIGWSRKSMLGDILGAPPLHRLYGSIAATVLAAMQGASIIRVHDVLESMDAIKVTRAIHRNYN